MDEIHIRRARRDDVPAIQNVARESWSDVYQESIPVNIQRKALENWYSTEALATSIHSSSSIFLVAEATRVLVGFAELNLRPDRSADLARIYILPLHQRAGIGTKLLKSILAAAGENRVSRITVSVATHNKRARAFYECSGFTLFGERVVQLFGFPLQEVMYEEAVET